MKKKFPGVLILVVGNSGSGKDSIISGAVNGYPKELKEIKLTKRYITRPPSEFENNYSISFDEFKLKEEQGEFALKWKIYGLNYGVPVEIDKWLEKGHPVLVNVSRMIIGEAREIYENIKVIFIEVPLEITIKRIKNRGRESGQLLKQRIERASANQTMPGADFIVDNSKELDKAIEDFLKYLITIVKD
jgi:ribose 1,5-bisphosphokinase